MTSFLFLSKQLHWCWINKGLKIDSSIWSCFEKQCSQEASEEITRLKKNASLSKKRYVMVCTFLVKQWFLNMIKLRHKPDSVRAIYLCDGKDRSSELVHGTQLWFLLFLLDFLIYIYKMLQTSCSTSLHPTSHVSDTQMQSCKVQD